MKSVGPLGEGLGAGEVTVCLTGIQGASKRKSLEFCLAKKTDDSAVNGFCSCIIILFFGILVSWGYSKKLLFSLVSTLVCVCVSFQTHFIILYSLKKQHLNIKKPEFLNIKKAKIEESVKKIIKGSS